MNECRYDICQQYRWDGDALCYFHMKIRDGLIAPDPYSAAGRVLKVRGVRRPHKYRERTIAASDVLTDQQLELARMMRQIGASDTVIARALTTA